MNTSKLSVRSKEFIQPIAVALDRDEKVVVWHQLPWSGGWQEWYLIRTLDGLDEILSHGDVASSAFTAHKWLELPLPRLVDQAWLTQALGFLQTVTARNAFLLGSLSCVDNAMLRLKLVIEEEDIEEWFEAHANEEALAGYVADIFAGEIVRGYFPDINGVPQSGAY